MIDLKLKEFYDKDMELATTGVTYEDIWRIIGHATAAHFILPYYNDNLYYDTDNHDTLQNYAALNNKLLSLLADRNFELNIYDVAGVYEHKRTTSSYVKLTKYFDVTNYFNSIYQPGEMTPIPQLKENSAYIHGVIELVAAILPTFDMKTLKESILSYGNNCTAQDRKRSEIIKDYIEVLKNEAENVIKNINNISPKESAFFAGKFSIFFHYEYDKYLRTSIVEAFFACKAKLPSKYREEFFADQYAKRKVTGDEKAIDDIVLLSSFENGLYSTLEAIYHSEYAIEQAIEKLSDCKRFLQPLSSFINM